MPAFSPYGLRQNDPLEEERKRRLAAGPVRGTTDRSGAPLPLPPPGVLPPARTQAPTVSSSPVAPPVVAASAPLPLSARERGIAFREAGFAGNRAGAETVARGTEFLRGPGTPPVNPAVADFVKGFATGELAPPPPPAPVVTSPAVNTALRHSPGANRAAFTPVTETPVAPVITAPPPRGPIGPPAPQYGQPLPPEGSVHVIRGTSSTIDRDGLSVPVGLESEPGRLAAGFRNLGLRGEEIPPAIVAQQGAYTDRLQAQGYVKQADAAMLNAGKPEFSEIQIAIPGRTDVNRLAIIKKNADGTIAIEDTEIEVPADITKTTRIGEEKVKTRLGEERTVQFLFDSQGRRLGDLGPANRQRPPEIQPDEIKDYDSAFDTASEAGEPPEQALQTALEIVMKKRARQKQREE